MRSYHALDHLIEVEYRAFPVVWWLLAGFEVRVDGQVFHPHLESAGFLRQPLTEFHLVHEGQVIPGMVRGVGQWFTLRKKRYSLVVGLSEIARETETMRGWQAACLVAIGLGLVFILAVLGVILVVLSLHVKGSG